MNKEENNKPEGKKVNFLQENKKIVIGIVAALVMIIAAVGAYVFAVNSNVKKWEGKVYPGVEVYGVSLEGKTKDQVVEVLQKELSTLISDKKLEIKVGDKTFNLKYSEISPKYDMDAIAKEAVKFGKDKGTFEKHSLIKEKTKHNIEAIISYDEEKLKAFIDSISSEVAVAPKDATLSLSGGEISVEPEQVGTKLDTAKVHDEIVKNINGNPGDTVSLTFQVVEAKPRVTADALNKVTGVIGSYESPYVGGDAGRIKNMELATELINGTLLMPGDVFSYNEIVGDTTLERGFHLANAYVNGEVTKEPGGGICQVSTALYRAVMRANIRSVERQNHSMMVGYSKAGLDATVFTPSPDYKFENTYDFPVYIQGYMTSGEVVFQVYGNKEAMGGKTYDMRSEILEEIPVPEERVDDPTLPEGQTVVKQGGMLGYKSRAYQVTMDANGNVISEEVVSEDYYSPLKRIIRVGTKKN